MTLTKKKNSLIKRWSLDKILNKDFSKINIVAIPQCDHCEFQVKDDFLHCKKYIRMKKPQCVLFTKKECENFGHKSPLQIEITSKEDDMFYGGYFGLIIGDTLGVPIEFTKRYDRAKDPVRELRAYGTYYQPFGTWSDDSSLTMCLAASIAEGFSVEDVAERFGKFYAAGYMTPHGTVFDIGHSTQKAIEKILSGANPVECGGQGERDNGNGSLMRILPLAYYTKNMEIPQRIKCIEDISALTHGHKRSKLACIYYVDFAISLLNGLNKEEAYKHANEFVKEYCYDEYASEWPFFEKIFSGNVAKIKEEDVCSSCYVIDTLEAALWSFLTTDNYQDAVFNVINLGGDTDTVAAVVGGLAGIFYGYSAIPKNWIDLLAKKEEIYEILKTIKDKE